MADEHITPHEDAPTANPSVLTGLSFAGGIGLLLIFVTLGVAVVAPPEDPGLVGLLMLTGFLLLIASIVGWFFIVQPHKHFDNINEPLEEEHH